MKENSLLKSILFVCVSLRFVCPCVYAQEERDTVKSNTVLEEVVVSATKPTSPLRVTGGGGLSFDLSKTDALPKFFGNADPIRYAQFLPGVSTNAEYQGGIHIQGCDKSHNDISIRGVPIYNAVHILGFFSTFNPTHYSSLELNKGAKTGSSSNRLGGELNVTSPLTFYDSTNFDLTVGLLSSQGTGRIRIGPNTSLTASARLSYINLLYGRWLRFDGDQSLKYFFYDANLTLDHRIDSKNSISVDYYGGMDNGGISGGSLVDAKARWGNQMGAFRYVFDNHHNLVIENDTYLTAYSNRMSVDFRQYNFALPSSIIDFGNKTKVKWRGLTGGMDIIVHDIKPQRVEGNDTYQYSSTASNTVTMEISAYLDYRYDLPSRFFFDAGIRGTAYGSRGTGFFWGADPSVIVGYDGRSFQIHANYFLRHQFLFQTGFTDIGLPTEFWFSSDKNFVPQYAHGVSLDWSCKFYDSMFSLSGDIFYKRLYNQVEYIGSLYDLAGKPYNLNENVAQGDGQNCGGSIMFGKCTGNFTGWVSYSYTHAERSFSSQRITGTYPANHERPHEVDVVASYKLGRHWDFGLTFIYASGTPFTAPAYVSLVNANFIIGFGEHNANRLPPYYRLDASVNFKWKSKHVKENGFNLSVYNLTCHKNALYYIVGPYLDKFRYHSVSFVTKILPSISYFCKF